MKYFQLYVYCGGIPVSILAVKNEKSFYSSISKAIYPVFKGLQSSIILANEGILVESESVPSDFVGSTIPFVHINRQLELHVMDTYWEK